MEINDRHCVKNITSYNEALNKRGKELGVQVAFSLLPEAHELREEYWKQTNGYTNGTHGKNLDSRFMGHICDEKFLARNGLHEVGIVCLEDTLQT